MQPLLLELAFLSGHAAEFHASVYLLGLHVGPNHCGQQTFLADGDRVSLCNLGYPRTCSMDQPG